MKDVKMWLISVSVRHRLAGYKNYRKHSSDILRAAGEKIGKQKHSTVKIHIFWDSFFSQIKIKKNMGTNGYKREQNWTFGNDRELERSRTFGERSPREVMNDRYCNFYFNANLRQNLKYVCIYLLFLFAIVIRNNIL